ncbi:hypothetical protein Pelo_10883 [Pelomyxa schiedti]|nr:hypothetical protein Pelo_10883 [Pelomyxa schiedti]
MGRRFFSIFVDVFSVRAFECDYQAQPDVPKGLALWAIILKGADQMSVLKDDISMKLKNRCYEFVGPDDRSTVT